MKSEVRIEAIAVEEINGKTAFVMRCEVIGAPVRAGQNMTLPYSSGLDMTIPVDDVEVSSSDATRIKILVRCDDEEDVEFLRGLNLADEVLAVT